MRLLFALSGLAGFVLATPAWADCHLKVGFEEWPPYTSRTTNGETVGIDADFTRAILARAGCSSEFIMRPWARALAELQSGKLDLVGGAGKSVDRQDYATFAGPYRKETMALVVRSGAKIDSLDELLETTGVIGVVRGYYYSPAVSAFMEKPTTRDRFKISTSDEENLKALSVGHLEGVIADFLVSRDITQIGGVAGKVRFAKTPVATNDIYLMLSKASIDPVLAEKISKAARDIATDGSSRKIINKYVRE